MKKKMRFAITPVLFLLIITLGTTAWTKDKSELKLNTDITLTVISMHEVDADQKLVSKKPYSGQITLYKNNTYKLNIQNMNDEGTFKYARPDKYQPKTMIFFYSKNKYTFYAYPRPNMLSIWISKTEKKTDIWLNAVPAEENKNEYETTVGKKTEK
jgi:hypothetical protein